MKKILLFSLILSLSLFACEPYLEEGVDLPPSPDTPQFTVEQSLDNPNKFIIKFEDNTFSSFVWDLPGGNPRNSTLAIDTVLYLRAGTYDISLHATKIGGGGTAVGRQTIEVLEDAVIECDENLTLLTDGCTSKCWKLSELAGSIAVGPTPLSTEWFTSTGLDGAQVDDLWCFDFDGASFRYLSNGNTFSACANYSVIEGYPIPSDMTYSFVPSELDIAEYKFTLSNDFWLGVEDSGPNYHIVQMDEELLVLTSPIKPCDGSASPGWFTLTLISE